MNKESDILYMTFNQDYGCFALATENGFKIYHCSPFNEAFSRDLGGGLGIVQMLYRCNVLALVGGGRNAKYPSNKMMLWDDHQTKCISEMTFRSEVKAVQLRSDRIVVVLENKIYVYNFKDLRVLNQIATCSNPLGLCSLNTENMENIIIACPDKVYGGVNIHFYDDKKNHSIQAHQSPLQCLELNSKGTRLATASEKGTLIRIFNPMTKELLQELRRGQGYAQIYSVCFNNTSTFLACSSDSGTIHIYGLKTDSIEDNKEVVQNPTSQFSFMKVVSNYFDSEWSFSQFRVQKNIQTKIAFSSEKNILMVLSYDGFYYTAQFDPDTKGECKLINKVQLLAKMQN